MKLNAKILLLALMSSLNLGGTPALAAKVDLKVDEVIGNTPFTEFLKKATSLTADAQSSYLGFNVSAPGQGVSYGAHMDYQQSQFGCGLKTSVWMNTATEEIYFTYFEGRDLVPGCAKQLELTRLRVMVVEKASGNVGAATLSLK